MEHDGKAAARHGSFDGAGSMTPKERQSLAEQLMGNPLWAVLMEQMEARAIERLLAANTDLSRLECQLRVHAVRTFRQDCEAFLRNTQPQKGAVA